MPSQYPTLMQAVFANDLEAVKHLMDPVDHTENMLELEVALVNKSYEIAQCLIPTHTSNKQLYNIALRIAVKDQHEPTINLLYGVSEPHVVLQQMQESYEQYVWGGLAARIKAQEEQQILNDCVSSNHSTISRKM